MLRSARPLSIVALACALAGLAALLIFLVAPLWAFCPDEGPTGTCPQTATLSTLLAVDPLAGRLLVAATLLPVIITILVLTARWTSHTLVRVLVWIATATLAVVLIWALLAHQPAALLVLPAFVAALLIALLVARRPLVQASA